MMVVRAFLGCLLVSNVLATAGVEGGVGVAPAPTRVVPVRLIDANITVRGEGLNVSPTRAYWDYLTEFSLKRLSAGTLNLSLAQPFYVKPQQQACVIPREFRVSAGDPLLYDFQVSGPRGREAIQEYATPDNQPGPFGFNGAYLWSMRVDTNPYDITQRYRTGVSRTADGNLQLVYHLQTFSLWPAAAKTPIRVAVWPNTPTRMCHELDVKAAPPSFPDVQVLGDHAHRHYVWHVTSRNALRPLSVCLVTASSYVRSQVVIPIVNGQWRDRLAQSSLQQLAIWRNAIYAQHGRVFKEPTWQRYFAAQWWYEEDPGFHSRDLTREDLKALRILAYYQGQPH